MQNGSTGRTDWCYNTDKRWTNAQKSSVQKYSKINNLHCRLKCNISSPGEWVNGFLYVGSTSGSVSTIAVSVMIWNETKVFCKLINGVKGYVSSISYIQETNSISLFVEMAQYANILFAPMTQLYSSSLETVESIPSDAINLDF